MFVRINRENAEVYRQMSKTFYQSPAVDHPVAPDVIERNIDRFIEVKDCEGYLLRYQEKWVGYVLISYMFSTETGYRDAWLEELYIDDAFRGHGFGTQVLEQLMKTLQETCGRIRLEVTAVNRGAIALYQRHGFHLAPYQQMIYSFEKA